MRYKALCIALLATLATLAASALGVWGLWLWTDWALRLPKPWEFMLFGPPILLVLVLTGCLGALVFIIFAAWYDKFTEKM